MFSTGVSQGLSGKVVWYEGDLMPGIDKETVEGRPIQREVYIYKATHMDQADVHEGFFYSNLKTNLVLKLNTDEEGTFIAALEPGMYSVFIKESEGLFANTFNEDGYINPVTIQENELVNVVIRVDYKAAY